MNHSLLTLGAFAALSSPVAAQNDWIVGGTGIDCAADFDGDGAEDILLADPATGHFTVGFGSNSHPDFAWWPAARALPFGGSTGALENLSGQNTWGAAASASGGFSFHAYDAGFRGGVHVAAGDMNGDGAADCLFTSPRHPAVYVFYGSTSRASALGNYERRPLGAGPLGIALADLDSTLPGLEVAVPVPAELPPGTLIVRPQQNWKIDKAAIDVMIAEIDDRLSDFGVLAPGTLTAGGRHSGHLGAWLYNKGASSELRLARLAPAGPPSIKPQAEPWTQLLAADMRGPNAPGQFVLWGEGLDSLKIVTVLPSAANDDRPTEEVSFYYNKITFVYAATKDGGRQNIAVGHSDGARVSILTWDTARNSFNATQELTAPPGRRFTNAAAMRNGLLLALDDGTYVKHEFNAAGQLVPIGQGTLPAMPAFGGHATVMLYTGDPLSGGAFEFESFAAGGWTSGATFAGGQIGAISEIFQSPALGLGSPLNIVLTPSANPGAAARAQGNQFGDASSSIFYAGGVTAAGAAGVHISPQPGVYNAPVSVKFASVQAGISTVYRINGQPWRQAGLGGIYLTGDSLVEYYGQSAAGARSTIESAAYHITPQPFADKNGDGLPDTLAASLGLDPGQGDADGDGATDTNEVLNGTDPHSAASKPVNPDVTLPPSLRIAVSVQTPPATGPLTDAPAPSARFTLFTAAGTPVRRDLAVVNGAASFTAAPGELPTARADEPGLSDFERALVAEITLPASDPNARGASLFGMAFAPGFLSPQPEPDDPNALAKWVAHTRVIFGSEGGVWRTTNFLTTDPNGPILINADTTLAVAAFSAWTGHRLAETGVPDAGFAWDHRGSLSDLPAHEAALVRQKIKTFQCPSNRTTPAWDLGAVAQNFYTAIATGPAYAPLRTAAREMLRRDLKAPAPGIRGPVHHAAQALLHFFDTGRLESYYADSISTPISVLTTLRTQLLGLPQPREVKPGVGLLRSLDGGQTWAIETAGGEMIALFSERRVARVSPAGPGVPTGTVTFHIDGINAHNIGFNNHNTGALRNLSNNNTYDGIPVQAWGFTVPAGEPLPPGADSAIFLQSLELRDLNLRATLNDTDGDRLDDAFEERYFRTLDFTFDDDKDGDGYTTGEEYFFLSDPSLAASRPAGPPAIPHNIATIVDAGPLTLAWDGRDGITYTVQESSDLGTWATSPVAPVKTVANRFEWTNPAPGNRRFVRIQTQFE